MCATKISEDHTKKEKRQFTLNPHKNEQITVLKNSSSTQTDQKIPYFQNIILPPFWV